MVYYTETVNLRFLIRPCHVRLVLNNGAPLKSALVERFPCGDNRDCIKRDKTRII